MARPKSQPQPEGEHVRQLASEKSARNYIGEIITCKNRTSTIGQTLSEATKHFESLGGNAPAARLASRFVTKAKSDPLRGRVMLEDMLYYLECMDFDHIAPKTMFTPEESGQRHGLSVVEGGEDQNALPG
jgi:hypothetical protein